MCGEAPDLVLRYGAGICRADHPPHVIILCPHSCVLRLDVCGVECNIPPRTGFTQLIQLCSVVFGSWCHLMLLMCY